MAVYASEDAIQRLPIHWMWWPAIGGLIIGLGGFILPQALGVGYDTIHDLLQGNVPANIILGILLVKSIIWATSLGSGTSGGVLAPLLMIGGALGGLEAMVLPHEGPGFWPLISMAAILGGTMRSPFTGIIFALELTHDTNALLPPLIACTMAHGFTVLTMRRSILTEKVSRRGYHLTREYATDPLEILFVRDVMRTTVVALSADWQGKELAQSLKNIHDQHGQHLYPVLDAQQQLIGVLTRRDLHYFIQQEQTVGANRAGASPAPTSPCPVPCADPVRGTDPVPSTDPVSCTDPVPSATGMRNSPYIKPNPVVCYQDEPLRIVVYRMAETNLTRFPVVERHNPHKLVGMISLTDLLKARQRNLHEEHRRERVLRLRTLFPRGHGSQRVI